MKTYWIRGPLGWREVNKVHYLFAKGIAVNGRAPWDCAFAEVEVGS